MSDLEKVKRGAEARAAILDRVTTQSVRNLALSLILERVARDHRELLNFLAEQDCK